MVLITNPYAAPLIKNLQLPNLDIRVVYIAMHRQVLAGGDLNGCKTQNRRTRLPRPKRDFATKAVLSDLHLKHERREKKKSRGGGLGGVFAALVSSECQPTPVHILWQADELTLFYSC